jgi:serine protease Do
MAMPSPSESGPRTRAAGLLAALSDELADLVAGSLPAVLEFTGRRRDLTPSSGSGFAFNSAGHVITNQHVIAGLASLRAVTAGGEEVPATLIGVDPVSDLAVLSLAEAPIHHLSLRQVPARVGELCVALGSPLGLYPQSASLGVVSGVARSVPSPGDGRWIEHAIQTDAAVNPGNSGGPLVDARGEVIGVNQSMDGRGAGISFAIPAETAAYVVDELLDHGQVRRAALGISVVTRRVMVDGRPTRRLAVSDVVDPESPLQRGDILLRVGSSEIAGRGDLSRLLTHDKVGKRLRVRILRDDRPRTLTVIPTALAAAS